MKWLTTAKGVLAAAGLVLSGGLWFSYVEFYSSLGATPSEAGVGLAQVLERSLGALLVIAAVCLSLLLLYCWLAFLLGARHYVRGKGEGAPKSDGRWPIARFVKESAKGPEGTVSVPDWIAVAAVLAFCIPVGVLAEYFCNPLWPTIVAPALVAATVGAAYGVRKRHAAEMKLLVYPDRFSRLVGVIVVFFSVAGMVVVWGIAHRAVGDVKDGQEILRTKDFIGAPTLGITGEPAFLRATSDPDSSPLPKACVIYLGQADGVTLALDPDDDTLYRASTSAAVVETSLDAGDCDEAEAEATP